MIFTSFMRAKNGLAFKTTLRWQIFFDEGGDVRPSSVCVCVCGVPDMRASTTGGVVDRMCESLGTGRHERTTDILALGDGR
jgi:hypothetical protein